MLSHGWPTNLSPPIAHFVREAPPSKISATLVEPNLALLGDPKRRLRFGWLLGVGRAKGELLVLSGHRQSFVRSARSEVSQWCLRNPFAPSSQLPFPLPGAVETRSRIECQIEPIVRTHCEAPWVRRGCPSTPRTQLLTDVLAVSYQSSDLIRHNLPL